LGELNQTSHVAAWKERGDLALDPTAGRNALLQIS
jgi:hypothetical protein